MKAPRCILFVSLCTRNKFWNARNLYICFSVLVVLKCEVSFVALLWKPSRLTSTFVKYLLFSYINLVFLHINLVFSHINLVFSYINLVFSHINLVFLHINLVISHINLVFSHINLVISHINLVISQLIIVNVFYT